MASLIDRVRTDGLSYRTFRSADELGAIVADDLALLLSERFSERASGGTAAQAVPRSPLPVPVSRFVGRDDVLSELQQRLLDPSTRLLTLAGPGGVGKTRLALELAGLVGSRFRDGVLAVMLAAVRQPDQVIEAIRSAIGLTDTSEGSAIDQLCRFLAGREVLLCLDNFEQVVDAAPAVATLLTGAPRVKAMVTSREILRVSGEQVYQVPPLEVPRGDEPVPELSAFEGVELFVDRARAVRPDLPLDDGRVRCIAQIVRRLEGLPLAIELAAARVRILEPAEILRRLDQRLALLTGGARDLPERQRALRLTIQWSYELLPEPERALFDELGVFMGGFSLDSVEVTHERATSSEANVLEMLTALVDRSLIATSGTAEGIPRFAMLETIREYALERLAQTGWVEAARRNHALHFLALAVDREAGYERGGEVGLVERFTVDQDNLRDALLWFLEHGRAGDSVRMGRALWRFWWVRGLFREGIGLMERALARGEELAPPERAEASRCFGHLAFGLSEYERALPHLHTAVELFGQLGDDRGVALASMPLAVIEAGLGAPAWEARLQDAIARSRAVRDRWAEAAAELGYGSVLVVAGRAAEAVTVLKQSVENAAALGTEVLLSYSLMYLGRAYLALDAHDDARSVLHEALGRGGFLESREVVSRTVEALAGLTFTKGNVRLAARLLGAAEAIRASIGAPVWRPDEPEHARLERDLRERLGEAALRDARASGSSLTFAEAVDLARRAG